VRAEDMKKRGIYMYHYSQIFLDQVRSKMVYYSNRIKESKTKKPIVVRGEEYFDGTFLRLKKPFRVHTVTAWPSWLERFDGGHPIQIQALRNDIAAGVIVASMRNMESVDELVKSMRYRIGIVFWKIWGNYITQPNRALRGFLRHRIGLVEFFQTLLHIVTGKKKLF
jgi:hypothetical protein